MRIHYFQHVPFEGLGNIEEWINAKGYSLSSTRFYNKEVPPKLDDIDWLIIMGGPMGAYEENLYPWLAAEKRFIGQAIKQGIKVLGICLGAQLIAAAIGAKVYPNAHKEIGWFPINLTKDGKTSKLFRGLPAEIIAYHWHGDTFDLPFGAKHLAESTACKNQAFSYKNHVLALQFHLDVRKDNIEEWVQSGAEELIEAPYIQTAGEMLSPDKRFAVIEKHMGQVLDRFAAQKC
ncbi:MAG: gamma-glutamyl-gamma-aminobutyrate hydrolase family protein [Smithellaceae bacterium]|jgi:GMP synthase (glutamine-hydrolysing)